MPHHKGLLVLLPLILMGLAPATQEFISYEVAPSKQLIMVWKNANGERYGNFQNLKSQLSEQGKELVFAMNGGMYQTDGKPLGLYIENGTTLAPINKVTKAYGNFYLQPNGIFYLTKNQKAGICLTADFTQLDDIFYATQSGPMLLVNGQINKLFDKDSKNLHVRNGVGILPNGNALFAMSTEKVSFYAFAEFFKDHDCQNALYLDGFVSRTYLPEKNFVQTDGNFGVIIAEVK